VAVWENSDALYDNDLTGEQQLFDIALAETEAEIQPDGKADDLGQQTVILVAAVGSWCVYTTTMSHATAA
jgi:hypothetical protein